MAVEVHPFVGQKCLVKGGGTAKPYVGLVVDWESRFPYESITVRHPFTGVDTQYAVHNVELLDPRSHQ